jgi:TIR domain
MEEASWKRLLGQIRDGFVVPIVGCRLLVDADGNSGLQATVARHVLAANGQSLGDNALPPFRELNEAVTRVRQNGPAKLQDIYTDVNEAIRGVTGSQGFVVPTPIRYLAEITGFRLFVTLTPDDLLAQSLRKHRAVNEIIHSPKLPTSERKDLPNDWGERPGEVQLLYLLGKSRPAPMFAIHDEDVLEYAHNVISRGSQVPTSFIGELQQRNLLLIGCNFPDWLSRFFLRATRQERLGTQAERREWLVEPLKPEESLTCFLQSYSKDTEILSESQPMDFVAELHRRWMAEYGVVQSPPTASPGGAPPSRAMFFISFSRTTDLPRAEALFQALLKLGVMESEIWFDRQNIEPGQALRLRILDGIRNCRYFLALLSHEADSREEAFVFDEWNEANLRNKSMNREFIFPVVVDTDFKPDSYTAKPVQEGEWKELLFCHAAEGAPDDVMTAKLTRLLREARRGS